METTALADARARSRDSGRPDCASAAPLSRSRWQALGTSAELLVLGDQRQLALARAAVERWLEQVDRACSRFRADSELSRLGVADGRAVPVSPTLIEATQLALRAARLTDGDVDPTLGEALERAGYDRDWALIEADPDQAATPASAPRLRVRRQPRWRRVRVDAALGTIQLPRGTKLDLGATAKAWAADRAAVAALRAADGCDGVLVSLGGDIATGGDCPPGGWHVYVTDDHRDGPDAPGQRIAIGGGGLATSSTAVRRWRRGGEQMHHIIDPRTNAPASTPWRTVSVAAEDCADANIAATAAIVRGQHAPQWLADQGLPARLVARDGSVTTVGSWPAKRTLENVA
ncbi:MAG TPA: FAD:protein FMN transferase [Solirubrobacteraceae bacterium]|jgi:thiamine biosynthesis lipoprotein|nr:FAD:protein FMN transferase [Solirubrobacteraceae bacterium]